SDGRLSDLLEINSRLTPAEGYNVENGILDVQLTFQPISTSPTSDLLVYPNPINSDNLYFSFDNPSAQRITIEITNLTGQIVRSQDFDLGAGRQDLTVNITGLEMGVYATNLRAGQRLLSTTLVVRQ
ncbi:MAG: T9SS type A sorting domain-containing protein, partial [Bacteroidota bacterium]